MSTNVGEQPRRYRSVFAQRRSGVRIPSAPHYRIRVLQEKHEQERRAESALLRGKGLYSRREPRRVPIGPAAEMIDLPYIQDSEPTL